MSKYHIYSERLYYANGAIIDNSVWIRSFFDRILLNRIFKVSVLIALCFIIIAIILFETGEDFEENGMLFTEKDMFYS